MLRVPIVTVFLLRVLSEKAGILFCLPALRFGSRAGLPPLHVPAKRGLGSGTFTCSRFAQLRRPVLGERFS